MSDIEIFLKDIIDSQQKGESFMGRWLKRFDSYYEKKFGSDWKKDDKEFWQKYGYWV